MVTFSLQLFSYLSQSVDCFFEKHLNNSGVNDFSMLLDKARVVVIPAIENLDIGQHEIRS